MDLVAKSWFGISPPNLRGLYRSRSWKASNGRGRTAEVVSGSTRAHLRGNVWGESFQQGGVDLRRAGQNVAFLAVFGPAERADAATGLLNQQRAGRCIPRRESDFPEGVDSSGRDISQIECRGAGT